MYYSLGWLRVRFMALHNCNRINRKAVAHARNNLRGQAQPRRVDQSDHPTVDVDSTLCLPRVPRPRASPQWERAAKAAEPGHGETFDSVLSQSVAVVSQLKKGVYAPRQGERVSETRLQAAGASQTAYDNMHSAGVDILDWEPSPHPDGSGPSPSRATSMRRGELARTNTRNALLAAVAIFTPRSATASPRSRNLTSDNGKGTSFRSSGMLAASGVAPPPAGAGQGGKAAAGASPARGSATRIGKLEQQQQDGASPRPRPPGGAASGEATTPRRVRLSLAQVPAGDGEEGDEEGLGAGFGSEAGGGSCAPTFRSKASSRPSFNRVSNNGTNRVSFNGTNRLSYNGSIRGSFNGARSCASSVYGGPDRDSGDSNYEYDSYDDDGVDTDACSHVSRAASRNSRTSARSRATTNSLGAFSDFDVDDDGSWTPHQGGAMISPAVLRGRSKAKARAMSRADEAIIELALNAYEPGEARHSLMVPPGGLGGAAGAGAEAGAASGASQLFDRRKLRVAVPPGEVPLAPVPRAVPAHVAHGLHAPTQVVLAAAEHGLLGPEVRHGVRGGEPAQGNKAGRGRGLDACLGRCSAACSRGHPCIYGLRQRRRIMYRCPRTNWQLLTLATPAHAPLIPPAIHAPNQLHQWRPVSPGLAWCLPGRLPIHGRQPVRPTLPPSRRGAQQPPPLMGPQHRRPRLQPPIAGEQSQLQPRRHPLAEISWRAVLCTLPGRDHGDRGTRPGSCAAA